ncbi:MAG: UDP-N-acetylmuramoyl-L-alanyl-D-glutamate--2,6-diaminopimelate ligase [Pseudomonadales bacterium]
MAAVTEKFSMSLAALLNRADLDASLRVSGLCMDSRKVTSGDLFIALPGEDSDGRDYIEQALENGAFAVLAESGDGRSLPVVQSSSPLLQQEGISEQLGDLALRFYGEYSADLSVIGITGTNGKTTCSFILSQLLNRLGMPCSVMGTLGYGVPGELKDTGLTTPDVMAIHRAMAEVRQGGAQALVVEVSSHALDQNRIAGVRFDTAVFTNLSHDHLDYHGDMHSYFLCKAKLFQLPGLQCAVVNFDDKFGRTLLANMSPEVTSWAYSASDPASDIYMRNMQFTAVGIRGELVTPWGEGKLICNLLGRFNLMNILAAIAVLGASGYAIAEILALLPEVEAAPGRMQVVSSDGPLVLVDYAHTPDALEQLLQTCRDHTQGQMWLVFGCGGDRDQSKREPMGRIATQYADRIVITNDNPRNENPQQIIDEILLGITAVDKILVHSDRAEAIAVAIKEAEPEDCVVLAGKGHEDYQEIAGNRIAFDDVVQARQCLALRRASR